MSLAHGLSTAGCVCVCACACRFRHDIVSLSNIDKEEFKGLEDSRKIIETMLTEEIESGTPSNKIILAGFSQFHLHSAAIARLLPASCCVALGQTMSHCLLCC